MTRENARIKVEQLDYYLSHTCQDYGERDHEAMMMAIKALEQEPVLDKIKAEIEQLPTTKCTETCAIYIDADDFKKNVLVIIDKYKTGSEGKE